MKDDDNLFEDDDALDYILYEEINKEGQGNQNKSGKKGCLGMVALFAFPTGLIGFFLSK